MLKEERAMKQVVLDGLVVLFKTIANHLFFSMQFICLQPQKFQKLLFEGLHEEH